MLIAAVFIRAAVPKIIYAGLFAQIVENYRMLPAVAVNSVALVVPWVEVMCALALLNRRWRTAGGSMLGVFLIVFMIAGAQALIRGFRPYCGCFDPNSRETVGLAFFLRDLALLGGVTIMLWLQNKATRNTSDDPATVG